MKRNGIEILINLLFWAVTGWFILTNFAITRQEIEIINDKQTVRTYWDGSLMGLLSLLLMLSAILFYFNVWNISRLNETAHRGRVVAYSSGAFALAFFLYSGIFILPYFAAFPRLGIGLMTGILLFYFAVSFGYGISKVWWKTESQRQQLVLEKKQAELDLLRAQLQPHFLFNVLNNLLAMVDQQQHPVLAGSIDRLSGLLRHVVYDSGQHRIPVEKEITFIRNYAELQLLRFESGEVDFELTVEGAQLHWVEPGIFLPFIENAFKHGVVPERSSYVKVRFDLRHEDYLLFQVCNPVLAGMPELESGGTGLAATRARLQIVYPQRHELTIQRAEIFRANLKLMRS